MVLLSATGLSVPALAGSPRALLPGPVDLEVRTGEGVGVLGPSGTGKTTLLRCLCLLEPRAVGEVRLRGAPIPPARTPHFRRQVTYLPQQPPALPMRVGASFEQAFAFKSAAGGPAADPERAAALCARLRLPSDVRDRWVPDLSVGEAQRVALVRALLVDPAVLLLDEFTSALDETARDVAEALIRDFLGEGERAAVLVSHDPAQHVRLSTRTVTLDREDAS